MSAGTDAIVFVCVAAAAVVPYVNCKGPNPVEPSALYKQLEVYETPEVKANGPTKYYLVDASYLNAINLVSPLPLLLYEDWLAI